MQSKWWSKNRSILVNMSLWYPLNMVTRFVTARSVVLVTKTSYLSSSFTLSVTKRRHLFLSAFIFPAFILVKWYFSQKPNIWIGRKERIWNNLSANIFTDKVIWSLRGNHSHKIIGVKYFWDFFLRILRLLEKSIEISNPPRIFILRSK